MDSLLAGFEQFGAQRRQDAQWHLKTVPFARIQRGKLN